MACVNKILLVNPFGIGDVLFTTPLVHSLKDAYPQAGIYYLCNSRSAELLRCNPFIKEVFIYDRDEFERVRKGSFLRWVGKGWFFIGKLRREKFDVALDFSLNTQYGFYCLLAGIKKRIGYDYKNRGRFLTEKTALSGYSGKHVIEYYSLLLKHLGAEVKYRKPEIYLREDDEKAAERLLAESGILKDDVLVGMVCGAGKSWGKDAYLKHWPVENFSALAERLSQLPKVKVLLLGDSLDAEIASKICRSSGSGRIVDLCARAGLLEFAALLKRLKLLVTNEGGPLHMAVAMDTKTISFFGPTPEDVYGPYPKGDTHKVITKGLDCRPCYRNFRFQGCNNDIRCLKDITVDEVFQQIRRLF